jgi:hypothetical protein
MINKNITSENVLRAIQEIDKNPYPRNRESRKYKLVFNNKLYPPKYVLSVANKFVNGRELDADLFNGGAEANNYLCSLGFTIKAGDKIICDGVQKMKE